MVRLSLARHRTLLSSGIDGDWTRWAFLVTATSAFDGADLLYAQAEAAALLKCPESWLRDRVTVGAIPHVRRGKVKGVRFTPDDRQEITRARRRAVTGSGLSLGNGGADDLASISDLRPAGRRGNRRTS